MLAVYDPQSAEPSKDILDRLSIRRVFVQVGFASASAASSALIGARASSRATYHFGLAICSVTITTNGGITTNTLFRHLISRP